VSTPAIPAPIPDPVERVEAAPPSPDNPGGTEPVTGEELTEVAQPDPEFTEPVDVDPPTGDDDDFEEVPQSSVDVTEENYEEYLPKTNTDETPPLETDPNTDVLSDEAQAAYDDAEDPTPQEGYEES
jgi:hypothetical protein